MASVLLCPSCKAVVPSSAKLRSKAFPFCSDRCRAVDLGRWFGGEYTVPQPIGPDDHEAIERIIQGQLPEG